ncbi:MAG: hypothetical protein U0359_02720 [Byssovorax sp.]
MKRFLFALALSAASFVSLAPAAKADVPPPNKAQCDKAKEGDACVTDDKKDGACTKDMCSRLDYSDGSPPSTVTEPCLLCKAGATPSESSSSGGSSSGGCSVAGGVPARSALWVAPALLFALRRRRAR